MRLKMLLQAGVVLALLGGTLAACRGTAEGCGVVSGAERRSIFVVGHGWHAGLVIAREDVSPARWPEQNDFPGAARLEVGWGDSAFYRTPDPGLGTTLKAGLWPTPSVLHVVGFRPPADAYFPESEVIRVDLTPAGLDSLAAFIHAAYAHDDAGRPIPLGPGLYGESRFYAGRERYHLFYNCNTWTARALRAAGCPIRPATILTVGHLLDRVRRFGTVIQED